MQHLKTLIDKASERCGGDAALSRRMGISKTLISLMRKGERTITPQVAAELADIAGDDARQAVIDAVIEGSRGTRKEGAMRDILGKALAAGVVGMSVFSYSGDSNSSTAQAQTMLTKGNTIYIVWRLLVRLLREAQAGVRSRERLLQRHVESMRHVTHRAVRH